MAWVLVAVFEEGRPRFISKEKLKAFVYFNDINTGIQMEKDWFLGENKPKPERLVSVSVLLTRFYDNGFNDAKIRDDKVIASFVDSAYNRSVVRLNNWKIEGDRVVAQGRR